MFFLRLTDASLVFLVMPVTSLFGMSLPACQSASESKSGTGVVLENILRERCNNYRNAMLPKVAADCGTLWNKFLTAFAWKDPCNVTVGDYTPFVEAAKQQIPKDRALFWSNTKDLANAIANTTQYYITLGNTMAGHLGDDLKWCGQKDQPGFNCEECPADCNREAKEAFWGAASRTFASLVSGEVTVLLKADGPAYNEEGFFARYELPVIKAPNVTVMLKRGQSSHEHCDTGSLALLKGEVERRNMMFHCEDNQDQICDLMCAHAATGPARECKRVCSAGSRIVLPSRGFHLVVSFLFWVITSSSVLV